LKFPFHNFTVSRHSATQRHEILFARESKIFKNIDYECIPNDIIFSTMMTKTFLLVLLLALTTVQAFVASRSRHALLISSSSSLSMAPKYDKAAQKWTPSKPEEGPEAGYPPINTLLLHGPKPFLQRVFTPDDYEQAVLKYMSGDKCSRDIAQGNMDAYLRSKFER
jgi:hypothetical protein